MLAEFFEKCLLLKRPEKISVQKYNNYEGSEEYEAVYSDHRDCYDIMERKFDRQEVRSSNAFIAYIKEELKRRKNDSGLYSTVKLHSSGGSFCADENTVNGFCTYSRLHSEQYITLSNYRDKVLDHEAFLLMLRELKPSIPDFQSVYKSYSKIRIVGQSQLTSNPIFNSDSSAEASYIMNYKLENGTDSEDVALPASFLCHIPFVKAGKQKYYYTVELLFFNTKSNEIAIKVQIPEWEQTFEQAIIDEAAEVKEALSEHQDLLVLADF